MISLSRLLGRDEKFYDLLEASAEEAERSAVLLNDLMQQKRGSVSDQALTDLEQSRRKHKRMTQEITNELCKTFVTPLEREDIEALSSALSKIPKNVEKIGERLMICPHDVSLEPIEKQVALLAQATALVSSLVKELRRKSQFEHISDDYEKLQIIEGDADKLMTAILRDLFVGTIDAKEVIILKDIYEMLEKVIDRCRDAGNVVFQIVLKYS